MTDDALVKVILTVEQRNRLLVLLELNDRRRIPPTDAARARDDGAFRKRMLEDAALDKVIMAALRRGESHEPPGPYQPPSPYQPARW